MKDKGISRNIGRSASRRPGDGPDLGHVNRMGVGSAPADASSPKGERRRRRKVSEEERAHQERRQQMSQAVVLRWSMIFGFLALVVLGVAVMFWILPQLERRKSAAASAGKVVYETIEAPEENVPGESESIRIVRTALAAKTPADVEKWIRLDTATAGEALEFLGRQDERDGRLLRLEWMPRLDTPREDISGVVIFYEKDGKLVNRLGLLVPDEDEKWKLDFPALARLSVPSWDDFLKKPEVTSALVRVYVARDQYYNGPFQEQEGWRCFGVASPDVPELLYGYCQVGTPQYRALDGLLAGGSKARVVLGLEKIEGASGRQFRIKRVMAGDWAVREQVADEE